MSIIQKALQRIGYVPATVANANARRAYRSARQTAIRSYAAAANNRLTADFSATNVTPDQDVRAALSIVRSRSRELCKNNPYGKRFVRLLRMNIPGPKGFKFQSNVTEMDLTDKRNPKRVQDKVANIIIEEAFAEWCKPENCSVTGRQSFKDIQHLAIAHAGRDGEILIREVRTRNGYQLQILEPDMLDEQYNTRLENGNIVRMGVELDKWRRPIAYYLLKNDPATEIYGYSVRGQQHERVEASKIIHIYDQESSFMTRGMPWTTASLMKLHMLGEYELSAVTKARIGANNLGFLKPDKDNQKRFTQGDDIDDDKNIIVDADPMGITELEPGMDFMAWDANYPSQQYEMFTKSIQRSIASGLDVSYMSLTTDLNDTTYGSGRIGIIDEREGYKERQEWFVTHMLNRIFSNWLEMALLTDLRLPMEKFDKFNKPVFIGRRWTWLDPLKDAQSAELLLKLHLTTRTQLAAEQGEDFVDILQDTVEENALAEEVGIDLSIAPEPSQGKPAEPDDDDMPPAKKVQRQIDEILHQRNGKSLTHTS